MARTVYFDETGKPRLVRSYCVFADFLGYRQQIYDAISKGEEEAVFRQFIEDVEPEIQNSINPGPKDDNERFPRMWDAKVFTDNIVLGYSLWSDRGEKEFGHAISQLLEFQHAVALKGYCVRGGWAIGNLFMNPNTVFGGSLLEAYHLENESAKYPRIVLSEGMKDVVFRHMVRYGEEPPQCYHLLADGEGILFLNYLSESIVDYEVMWDDLHRHASIVRERLAEHANNERVLIKYQWLAAYHNFFCELVRKGDGYSDTVKIPGEYPSFGFRQLRQDDSPYMAEERERRRIVSERLAKLKSWNR